MTEQQTVLLVGGTGRTGKRVLLQLLNRGICVRVIVRSSQKLPVGAAEYPGVRVVEADLLTLGDQNLQNHVRDCAVVISCLGHVISLKGVLGPPRDLVTRATTRLCRGIEALEPAKPVKFILMSSVSVNDARGCGTRRGVFEKVIMGMLRILMPPAKDNQHAADFLSRDIGMNNRFVQWAVVRPDTLLEGDVSEYTVHTGLVNSLFAPGRTNMANVAHFMCELAVNAKTWDGWKGKLPVIVNAGTSRS
jgi:nucleoside-diphosphate-sugar epimerase